MTEIIKPKKLIEVSVPLEDINRESAREKSIRHGHPSTLHLWWARRPLAAARAVVFAQMVNDPGWNNPNPTPQEIKKIAKQRDNLFKIMRKLVIWENSDNEKVLKEAREEIWKSWRETCEANKDHPDAATLFNPNILPCGHDPFAGGGAIPLEMQRLGLTAYASDLNPVAVMINKAMIELPPKCAGKPPVNNSVQKIASSWKGCKGLAEDIEYYGRWMRDEAYKRIGHLYPKVEITKEMTKDRPDLLPYVGEKLTVIAWLWARTVKSPNPAFSDLEVPLVSTYWLSNKKGSEAYIQPVINGKKYSFVVKRGMPDDVSKIDHGTKAGGRGSNFNCIFSNTVIDGDYIKSEGMSGRLGSKLIAVVADGKNGRVYLSPTEGMEKIALNLTPKIPAESSLPEKALGFNVQLYGMVKWHQLYSKRQLTALTTFSELLPEVIEKIKTDSNGNEEYANVIATYLSFVIDKCADYWSTVCSWHITRDIVRNTFGRQAIPIIWDYAETNPFSESTGNWISMLDWVWKVVEKLPAAKEGFVLQADAQTQTISMNKVVSTDPPYYDNIGYADLSDYFYYWMRPSLKNIYPDVFGTIKTAKDSELIADPHRRGSKKDAEKYFMDGMTLAMSQLASLSHPTYPVTIYYAFKQAETKEGNTASTGWETFIEAVIKSGFAITGTLPMRTELGNRMRGIESNALASSIVLVCRRRESDAEMISRKEFIRELNKRLPEALELMTGITPDEKQDLKVSAVDLAQSAIGPGMAIFSKYSGVLEANGSKMTVHEALIQINKVLSAYLDKDDDESDEDTKFCKVWFEKHGWKEGEYGEAELLSKAKGTSVEGLVEAGVVKSGGGKVQLIHFKDYPDDWDPQKDKRLPIWEGLHYMVKYHQNGGETKARGLYADLEYMSQSMNLLATRLYQICEQKGWAEDARPYNELTASWQAITDSADRNIAPARDAKKKRETGQRTLSGFGGE